MDQQGRLRFGAVTLAAQKKRALNEGPSGLPLALDDQSKYLRSVMPQVRGWFG